jgi:hypothetical protein
MGFFHKLGAYLGLACHATARGLVGFKNFAKSAFQESDGTTSSSRTMMFIFSCFTMWLLWRVFWHVFRISDTTQLTVWLSNLPPLIAALCGLIVLPYTVNQGSQAMQSTFQGIASVMSAAKQAQANSSLVSRAAGAVQDASVGAGSDGAKG